MRSTHQDNGHRTLLIAWLNDAHAMEQALIPILEDHARDAKRNQELHHQIQEHVYQTRRHADLVRDCVERLGGRTSMVKSGLGRAFGMVQSVATGMTSDDLVKNAIMDIAAEHFEIACYRALIAAAQDWGDQQIVDTCKQILSDEEHMAHYLEQQLPQTVLNVMHDYAVTHVA